MSILGFSSLGFGQTESSTTPASTVATTADASAVATDVDNEALLKETTVVGSHIKHDAFNGSAPIEVVTRDEGTEAGLLTTAGILQSNAITGGSSQLNNYYAGFVNEGGPGTNTIGLRGLGAKRTLILLNGRRLAPAGLQGAVGSFDLNALPNAMIDRLEVLKDGASSVYGSDAVGGVVNVITRKHIDGLDIDTSYETTDHGGGQGRLGIVGGVAGDRGEIAGAFEYYQRDEMTFKDVGWADCQTQGFTDKTRGQTLDFIDVKTGRSKCYPVGGFGGTNGVTINNVGTVSLTGVPAPGAVGTKFTRWHPNPQVATGLVGFEGVGGGANGLGVRDGFDPRYLNSTLINPEKTFNFYAQGNYNLQVLGNATPYFEFLWNRRESGSTDFRQLVLDYPAGSPLIPAALQTDGATPVTFPTSSILVNGPVGVRLFLAGGNTFFHEVIDDYRGTAGVRGDISAKWHYDVNTNFSLSSGFYSQPNWLTDRLKNSLNVTNLAADLANTDPALIYDGRTCKVNVKGSAQYNANARCIPAPKITNDVIYGRFASAAGNTSGPDWVKYTFDPDNRGNTTYWESSTVAGVDGTLFKLPYGDVKTALGLEVRTAHIDDTPSLDSQSANLYNFSSAAITRGSDTVVETYGELEIPLLANLPMAHELTFDASARYTHYNSYGSGFTFKTGGFWSPVEWITARANYGTSYRAPALFEQFQGASAGFLGQNTDPCNDFQSLDPSSNVYKNCLAEVGAIPPANNPDYPNFLQKSSVGDKKEGGAATGLAAETSRNITAGIILQPKVAPWFGDVAFALDYYNIEVDNSVAAPGAGTLLQLCYGQAPANFVLGQGFCRFVSRSALDYSLTVLDDFANVAKNRVSGIDYTLRYVRKLGAGKLRINALLTQYFEQSSQNSPIDRLIDFNATVGEPSYTGQIQTTYSINGWSLFYGLTWVAAMNKDYSNPAIFDPPVDPASVQFVFDLPDYFLHDASVRYAGNDWEVMVGVRNLFDKHPPSISDGFYSRSGNAPVYSGYDFAGRSLFINAKAHF